MTPPLKRMDADDDDDDDDGCSQPLDHPEGVTHQLSNTNRIVLQGLFQSEVAEP
jgi:hypothetical protein